MAQKNIQNLLQLLWDVTYFTLAFIWINQTQIPFFIFHSFLPLMSFFFWSTLYYRLLSPQTIYTMYFFNSPLQGFRCFISSLDVLRIFEGYMIDWPKSLGQNVLSFSMNSRFISQSKYQVFLSFLLSSFSRFILCVMYIICNEDTFFSCTLPLTTTKSRQWLELFLLLLAMFNGWW